MPKVLVFGWYEHSNLGDQLFKVAFQRVFPSCDFIFTDRITIDQLLQTDAVFIGGGSLLGTEPVLEEGALPVLMRKPCFYISVGAETNIHPTHQKLMARAKLIVIRTPDQLKSVQLINPSSIYLPDFVYALQSEPIVVREPKSVLILPNFFTVPQWDSPYWMHIAWSYFKLEFAQFVDRLYEDEYRLDFFPMAIEDMGAATELINQMRWREHRVFQPCSADPERLLALFASYETVITQRYHGIVLAEMARTPYLAIHHHDKLKSSLLKEGEFVSFYGTNKQALLNAFDDAKYKPISSKLPIDPHLFEGLNGQVLKLIG